MTPIDRILTEGDITWRLDRGWRIASTVDGTWWWYPPEGHDVPPLALTDHETEVWETTRPEESPDD